MSLPDGAVDRRTGFERRISKATGPSQYARHSERSKHDHATPADERTDGPGYALKCRRSDADRRQSP